jgi:DNA adenine methylase
MIADGKRLQLLMYPGSKGRILDTLYSIFPSHSTYIEPFGGSYVVLMHKDRVPVEAINDIDPGITALAYCYLFCPDELVKAAENDLHSQGLWKLLKEKQDGTMIEKALTKLYLICHSFSGMGKSFAYCTNVPKDCGIKLDKEKASKIHERLRYVHIFSEDYQSFLKRFIKVKNGFIYLDPPYVVSDEGKHYSHNFTEKDHENLFSILDQFDSNKVKWLMSYDKQPFIEKLYEKYNIEDIELWYTLARPGTSKVTGNELLISNYDYKRKEEDKPRSLNDYFQFTGENEKTATRM